MYTRCPYCDTVFRVTPQQLQVSSGQVRCGRCEEVFDAFATLSSRLPGAGAAQDSPAAPHGLDRAGRPAGEARAAPPEGLERARGRAGRLEPAAAGPERGFTAAAMSREPTSEPQVLTLPDELFGAAAGRRQRRWPWAIGSLVALVALAAQAAWFFPGEIALQMPAVRPALERYCALAGCRIELPQLPDQLFIEASELQSLDPAHPGEVLLTATIRNRAQLAQALPMLELTLTDAAQQIAARKVFTPAEYLGAGLPSDGSIGASQELSVRLYLDTGDLKAAGYRLYLFFA
jgi:predicted Zn finger-like uncharacterized protein